jgi:hypothetical protein
MQLLRGGPLPCYFQPVEIILPEGAGVAFAESGAFGNEERNKALVGMRIGHAYTLKITNIPLNEGVEIFPTIELLDRLYPPRGQELRFPIPIELTLEELDHAAAGRMVTRVIYLETPDRALGVREEKDKQRYFEVDSSIDPLEVADRIGRPMAILRMGSRIASDEDVRSGKIEMAPLMKYRLPTPAGPEQGFLPREFHADDPRIPLMAMPPVPGNPWPVASRQWPVGRGPSPALPSNARAKR